MSTERSDITINVLIAFAFVVFVCKIVDSSCLTDKKTSCEVRGHKYVAEHYANGTYMIGDVLMPYSTHVPSSYILFLDIDGHSNTFSVDKGRWNKIEDKDTLCCIYTKSRLFNSITIKSLCKN